MKKITVVEVNDLTLYPPVQTLVRILLKNGYRVDLIGANVSKLPDLILENGNCRTIEIPIIKSDSKIKKWRNRLKVDFMLKKIVKDSMMDSDYLWTTSMNTIRSIGEEVLKYKNVLQLMELSEYGYKFKHLIKFPIDDWARRSWRTVVPEINRAYIQKIWWHLEKTPYVLPNKPFSIDPGELSEEVKLAAAKMQSEKRKIVLYLGGIYPDRNLEDYAKAINKIEEYAFYIVGKAFSNEAKTMLNELIKKYSAEYLGAFSPPMHLALVKHAYIGLLPYKPIYGGDLSELNALYCAPNKIFEYAGYGVPMVGSDVLGLRLPFEKWSVGFCCNDNSYETIYNAISRVDANHEEMSRNCKIFFNSIDLDNIVLRILEETEK